MRKSKEEEGKGEEEEEEEEEEEDDMVDEEISETSHKITFASLSSTEVSISSLSSSDALADFTSNDYEALLSLDQAAGSTRGVNQVNLPPPPPPPPPPSTETSDSMSSVAEGNKAPPCAVCLDPLNAGELARIL
eukprot:763764-Hanusia_phi.AAC.1